MSDTMGSLAQTDEYDPFAAEKFVNPVAQSAMGALLAPRVRDENSPVEYTTASPLVNITTQDIADATDKAMAFSGGGLGIKAYHSSPHDFDRFDLSKIGTGEGAQVYGHGLYFAENPAVSGQGGQYWNQFMSRFEGTPEGHAAGRLRAEGWDRDKAIAATQRDVKDWMDPKAFPDRKYAEKMLALRQAELDALVSGKPVGPRTYEVNINADPAHMMNWDARMQDQPPGVQDYFKKQIDQFGYSAPANAQYMIARSRAKGGGATLSAGMNEAGIPGIKYLDQGSRLAQRPTVVPTNTVFGNVPMLEKDPTHVGTHNYVVFNPNLVDIMKKYGLAGAAPVGMGALAAQDQYSNGGM